MPTGKSAKPAPASISITPVNDSVSNQRATQAKIADTMRQIRLAEAQGQPADNLRQQLSELVEKLNSP